MSKWIKFHELKQRLDFRAVLDHYQVELSEGGTNHLKGSCPFPRHRGSRRAISFSADLERKVFRCTQCGSGSILDFACLMTGGDPRNFADVRKVAMALQEHFFSKPSSSRPANRSRSGTDTRSPRGRQSDHSVPVKGKVVERPQVIVNQPLDFSLKNLDPEHQDLKDSGLLPQTIAYFGLGYCNRGLLAGRVAVPLHDAAGKLIGYAGWLADREKLSRDDPEFLFPTGRERDGVILEFEKSKFLYNGHRIQGPVDDLIVVTDLAEIWFVNQCGETNVVATMGPSCSKEQAQLIAATVKPTGCVWILTESDDGGAKAASSIFTQMAGLRAVRWAQVTHGRVTECTTDDLEGLLAREVMS